MLLKRPGTSAIAVLALALGIGLTTTMFSIVQGAFLRGLPFERVRPHHVDRPHQRDPPHEQPARDGGGLHRLAGVPAVLRAARRLQWRQRRRVRRPGARSAIGRRGSRRTCCACCAWRRSSAATSRTPTHRRALRPSCSSATRSGRRSFERAASAIGQTVRINGEPTQIVGVMPDRFAFPQAQDLWRPLRLQPATNGKRGSAQQVNAVGRLKPGVSLDRASAEMTAIARRLQQQYPENKDLTTEVLPYVRRFLGQGRHLDADGDAHRGPGRAAHRVRQRRQPAAGARGRARQGNRAAHGAGGRPLSHRPPAARRGRAAGRDRRRARHRAGLRGHDRVQPRDRRHEAAVLDRHPARRHGAGVRARRDRALGGALEPDARHPRDAPGSERRAQGREPLEHRRARRRLLADAHRRGSALVVHAARRLGPDDQERRRGEPDRLSVRDQGRVHRDGDRGAGQVSEGRGHPGVSGSPARADGGAAGRAQRRVRDEHPGARRRVAHFRSRPDVQVRHRLPAGPPPRDLARILRHAARRPDPGPPVHERGFAERAARGDRRRGHGEKALSRRGRAGPADQVRHRSRGAVRDDRRHRAESCGGARGGRRHRDDVRAARAVAVAQFRHLRRGDRRSADAHQPDAQGRERRRRGHGDLGYQLSWPRRSGSAAGRFASSARCSCRSASARSSSRARDSTA